MVMGVTDMDAETAGVPREELARRYAAAIQTAIESYRARHTWRSFLLAHRRGGGCLGNILGSRPGHF